MCETVSMTMNKTYGEDLKLSNLPNRGNSRTIGKQERELAIGTMTILLYPVLFFLALSKFEADAAIPATLSAAASSVENMDACGLLKSCLNASESNYAACDSILDDYQPPCWQTMKSLVQQLRASHLAETAQIISCLSTDADPNDNVQTANTAKNCASMLGSYRHIASENGWTSRKKRDTSKDWVNFYKCINNAERLHSICTQLSGCCPKAQKCEWQTSLLPSYAPYLNLKLQLFAVKQKCINTLDKDGMTEYDDWNILGKQPMWTDN